MKIYSPEIIGNTSVSGALNVQGDITGSSMYLSNGAIIAGDLTVNGTTTFISSSTLEIGDNIIEINYNRAAGPSGMIVYDTTSPFTASMLWDDVNDAWMAGPYGAESPIILSNQTASMSVASASFATSASNAATAANGFPFTGSAQITGSLGITGSVQLRTTAAGGGIDIAYSGFPNTTNTAQIFVLGSSNTSLSTTGGVIGTSNNVDASGNANFAFGISNSITSNINGNNNMLLGRNNTLTGSSAENNYSLGFSNVFAGANGIGRVLVGYDHNSLSGSYNGVFAGNNNTVSHNNSVVIGGTGISSNADNTVFVPNLDVSGSTILEGGAIVTGSLIVSASAASTASNVVGNWADTFTSSPAVHQIITLTQAEYNALTPNANTLYVISGSTFTAANLAGNNVFTASNVFSGSVRGEVRSLSISSNTASLDLSTDNFFTLQLVSGSNTFINPTNILPGQTVNIRINTTGSGTVSFPSSVKQVSGSAYVPTTTTGVDVITLIAFDNSALYLSNVKNLV